MVLFAIAGVHVATGPTHKDRVLGHVSVVNSEGTRVLASCVRATRAVFSSLKPLTGITEYMSENGTPREEVALSLRQMHIAAPTSVFIGMNVRSVVRELGLSRGKDYASLVDFDRVFSYKEPIFGGRSYFHLNHIAAQTDIAVPELLSSLPSSTEAYLCMMLYTQYGTDPDATQALLAGAAEATEVPRVEEWLHYRFDGVCLAAKYLTKCSCAAGPTLAAKPAPDVPLGKLSIARRRKERRVRKKNAAKAKKAEEAKLSEAGLWLGVPPPPFRRTPKRVAFASGSATSRPNAAMPSPSPSAPLQEPPVAPTLRQHPVREPPVPQPMPACFTQFQHAPLAPTPPFPMWGGGVGQPWPAAVGVPAPWVPAPWIPPPWLQPAPIRQQAQPPQPRQTPQNFTVTSEDHKR